MPVSRGDHFIWRNSQNGDVIDWQLSNASVHFGTNGDLVRRTDVARRVDNKADIARLDDSGGRPRRCVGGWLNDRTMTPKKIASGAETGEHD